MFNLSALTKRAFRRGLLASTFCFAPLSLAAQNAAQHDHMEMQGGHAGHDMGTVDHSMHEHGARPAAAKKKKPTAKSKKNDGEHTGHPAAHNGMPGMSHDAHSESMGGMNGMSGMTGFLGRYPMTREGSGTSWVPDATPHEGIHNQFGSWMTMWHAQFNTVYDHQGGPRGGDKTFVNGMVMGMAQQQLSDGTLGFRTMLSLDPFMGANGYPLLLATGETADGHTHLVDRQHPHDLFMELAATYSHQLSANSSAFIYAGLPGEPALGPPAFMHRTSGMDIPEAPITHHWLDSTHITWGVVTTGLVLDTWKLEASAFRGRESDQYRYDIEALKLDSFSGRVSWNPIRELSMQVSWGHLHSPEQLEPKVDEDRLTASVTYTQPFGKDDLWSTTLAWGRKMNQPGNTLDGVMLETAVILQNTYTLFARAERVQEDELIDSPAIHTVNKISLGGIYDFWRTEHAKVGIGALASFYSLGALDPAYGSPTSYMVFGRIKVQ